MLDENLFFGKDRAPWPQGTQAEAGAICDVLGARQHLEEASVSPSALGMMILASGL